MKIYKVFFMAAVALAMLLAVPNYASAYSISYKGKVGNNNNSITITAEIYDAKTGGTLLWGTVSKSVTRVSGRYTVEFGEADMAGFDALFTGQDLWLVIDEGGTTFPPQLMSSGYSIRSGSAATADVATIAIDSDTVDGHHMDQDVLTTSSPSFSSVTAATFTGSLTGNADTATSAATATNSDQVDGFDADAGTVANTVPVRDGSGLLPGSITGNAATATTATSATTATTAGYATTAGSATTATTATTAGFATNAGNATTADSASTATTATTAGYATTAGDAATVDGYSLDQDVQTSASPTFSSVTATTFIGNLTGSVDNADKVDGFDADAGTVANTVPVRDGSGLLPGSITGNAATATTATTAGYATTAGDADTTDGFHLNQDVRTTASPSFSSVTATTFNGNLNGNATTATTAGFATTAGDAATVDGYSLNQNVLTGSTPSFNGLKSNGSTVINSSNRWVGLNNPSYIRYCFYRWGKDIGKSEEGTVAIPNDESAWPDQFCCNYANNLGSSNFWEVYLRKVYANGTYEGRTCTLN